MTLINRILIFLFASLVCLIFISPGSAWLSGYDYRQSHVINGDSGWSGDQTSYPVRFTVYTTDGSSSGNTIYLKSHSLSDLDDLRITDSSDTVLDYWIEEQITSSPFTLWVEVGTVAKTGDTTLYFYYGKSDATAVSSGTNTFTFFDDFDDTSYDTGKWTTVSGTAEESDGMLKVSQAYVTEEIRSNNAWGLNYATRARNYVYTTGASLPNYQAAFFALQSYTNWKGVVACYAYNTANGYDYWNYDGAFTYGDISGVNSNTWFIQDIKRYSGGNVFKINDANTVTLTTNVASDNANARFYVNHQLSTAYIYCDWIAVMKSVSPDVSHGTWGSEIAKPTAAFTADDTSVFVGDTVTFTDTSTGSPTSWAWSWDDGTANSTSQNPTHSWDTAGNYTVALTATNIAGSDTEEKVDYITVTEEEAEPTPTPTPSSGVVPSTSSGSVHISPFTFVLMMFADTGLMFYTFAKNEDRNYLYIVTSIGAVILSIVLAMLLFTGFVADAHVVPITVDVVNETSSTTYGTTYVEIVDYGIGYYLLFIGVIMLIITILAVTEMVRDSNRNGGYQ